MTNSATRTFVPCSAKVPAGRDSHEPPHVSARGRSLSLWRGPSAQMATSRPPGVGASTLYNQTYSVQVDDQSAGTPNTNSVISSQSTAPAITSIITVTAELNASEPNGQASADNVTTNPNSTFTFDELGLTTNDSPPLLLSHLIFSPFEKTANRAFQVIYTLTVSVS